MLRRRADLRADAAQALEASMVKEAGYALRLAEVCEIRAKGKGTGAATSGQQPPKKPERATEVALSHLTNATIKLLEGSDMHAGVEAWRLAAKEATAEAAKAKTTASVNADVTAVDKALAALETTANAVTDAASAARSRGEAAPSPPRRSSPRPR